MVIALAHTWTERKIATIGVAEATKKKKNRIKIELGKIDPLFLDDFLGSEKSPKTAILASSDFKEINRKTPSPHYLT